MSSTRRWWQEQRHRFELWISELVVFEIGRGDSDAAAERLALIDGIGMLVADSASETLSDSLVRTGALPLNAVADATHIALAAVNGMRYLMTWNCKHTANGETLPLVEDLCREAGYEPPRILTPEELTHGRVS